MGSKKTSGIVICLLWDFGKVKTSREHRPADTKRSQMDYKKTSVFFKKKILTTYAFSFWKTCKNVLMLVFFGPFTRFFALFKMGKNPEKSEKCPKNRIFSIFSLCSATLFPIFQCYTKCSQYYILWLKIKT